VARCWGRTYDQFSLTLDNAFQGKLLPTTKTMPYSLDKDAKTLKASKANG